MNETTIENFLFRAPRPAAPSGLLQKLQAEIALPAKKTSTEVREWRNPVRWRFPALAFGSLMLSCVIMIAVQAGWSTSLKRQNEALRAAVADLPQLREQHAALEKAASQQDELAQLRKDNQELHQLQAEVARLGTLQEQTQRLQDDNRRLEASLNTLAPAPVSAAKFFEDAERFQCVNNLKILGLAVRIWAGDNNEKYPTSLVVMSNELNTAKYLICPSDQARQAYGSLSWSEFRDDMTSYQFLAQPDDFTHPDCIIAKCPTHNIYLLADGSVQQPDPEKTYERRKDGRLYLEAAQPGATYQGGVQKKK